MQELAERSRGEYFPSGGGFAGDPRDAPAAEVRYLEWMLFERDHDGGLLVEALLPAWRSMATPGLAAQEAAFLGTSVGMFLVGPPAGDGIYWLRDIAGLGEYAVELRTPIGAVDAGDLIVGRLYPAGDSAHTLSPGAGCFRDEALLSAVQRDLELARKSGQRKALRMRQSDLEAMFWGLSSEGEGANPVDELHTFLKESGLEDDEVGALVEALSLQPLPEDTSSPLVAGYLGELLDHLAFNTEVDLSAAQERLLACWVFLQSASQVGSAELVHFSKHNVDIYEKYLIFLP